MRNVTVFFRHQHRPQLAAALFRRTRWRLPSILPSVPVAPLSLAAGSALGAAGTGIAYLLYY